MYIGIRRFFARIPKNWDQLLGLIAYTFHFQPSEVWEFNSVDIEFWLKRLEEISDMNKNGR